jgi:3-hydroxyisobutyrate dehydrogenase-like beta-hydroxyacid dehydrogenase
VIVDSSTVSADASERVGARAAELGSMLMAAPVSGNPSAVRAGDLAVVASGPPAAMARAEPHLVLFGASVTYVGEGESARFVKICHNLILGTIAQSLAEVLVLAERAGVSRSAFLAFLNSSVLGSTFTRYKTPALVGLDFTPTFTPELLLKDLDLGLDSAGDLEVELPLTRRVRELVEAMISAGYRDVDFAAMLEVQARAAGLELSPEEPQQ